MAFNIPVAMQEVAAPWTGNAARLAVSEPVAPEFVEAGWPHRTPTVFYPGGSLWTPDRLEQAEFDELRCRSAGTRIKRPPAVAEFDSIFSRFTSAESPPSTGDVEEMARRRQVEDGEVMVGAAAHYVHGAQAAGEVVEDLRVVIKEVAALNVLPVTLWALR